MAVSKKNKQLPIKEVIFAGAGGAAAGALTQALENNITFFQDRPNLVPMTVAALGFAGLYFMDNEEYKPAFYGMIGSAGNDIANSLIDGMNQDKSMQQNKAIDYNGDLEDFLLENMEIQQLPTTKEFNIESDMQETTDFLLMDNDFDSIA